MSLWNKDVRPMLLGEVEEVFDSKDYLYEVKYDGIRVLVFVSKDKIVIKSRYGIDITGLFPEMSVLCKMVDCNVIFDGEIIMLQNNKVSFSKLQKRIHLKNKKTIEFLSKTNPVVFMCFDVIYEDKDLINLSLLERKKLLSKYEDNEVFIKCTYVSGEGIKLFDAIKKLDSRFLVGGPAVCGGTDEVWIRSFMEYCETNDLAVDFVTRHHYTSEPPKTQGHYSYIELMDPEDGFANLHTTREIIDSFPRFKGLPIHITEFNTSYVPNCPIHDTNQNAAYIAHQLSRLGDDNESYSYWTFGDVFEEFGVPFTPFHGGFGLVANGCIPKPTFWTFAFYKKLNGTCNFLDICFL